MIKFENARPDAAATAEEKAALVKKLGTETGETDVSTTRKRSTPAAKPAKEAKAPQSDLLDL